MKKVLLLTLTILVAVACKKSVGSGDEIPGQQESLIALSSAVPSGRAANQGIREGLFQAGDQIGVIAAYSDGVTTPGTAAPIWTWGESDAKKLYFDNKPAMFSAAKDMSGTASTTVSVFGWGADGQGGLTANQYYPSKNAAIFLYAYYPYADGAAAPALYTTPTGDGTSRPSLNVMLKDGEINGNVATDVNMLQSDVLWYAGATGVSSNLPTSELAFKHGLAQLQFLVKRSEISTACKLTKIVFKTVKEGTLDITTGLFTYPTTTSGYETAAIYTITPKAGIDNSVPVSTASDPKSLNLLTANGGTPLMILPLDLATAQKGFLEVTCDYSTNPDNPQLTVFPVPLTVLSNANGLEQGKLNTYSISVSKTEIKLEATITPWDQNGNTSDLETE